MKTIAMINFYILVIIGTTAVYVGLDLRKWHSWIIGLYGFVSGFLIGLLWVDTKGALITGGLFALGVLYGGATTRWHMQRDKEDK